MSFSKAKKADSKSEESASTLRPIRDPLRSRDPRAEMLRRHAELGVKPAVAASTSDFKKRLGETDPLKGTVRVAYAQRGGSGLSLDPVQIGSCPTPLQKRYEVLKIMMRESRRLYPTNHEVQKQVRIRFETI